MYVLYLFENNPPKRKIEYCEVQSSKNRFLAFSISLFLFSSIDFLFSPLSTFHDGSSSVVVNKPRFFAAFVHTWRSYEEPIKDRHNAPIVNSDLEESLQMWNRLDPYWEEHFKGENMCVKKSGPTFLLLSRQKAIFFLLKFTATFCQGSPSHFPSHSLVGIV